MSQVLIQLIATYSMLYGIDPEMALAVATHESKLNSQAVGTYGELGLMQLRPEYYAASCKNRQDESAPCGKELFNPETNLQIGIKALADMKKRCGHKKNNTWLVCYNAGVKGGSRLQNPKEFAYYKHVIQEYKEIQKSNFFVTAQGSIKTVASNP
jgi:soluble lytic murein transglycosylase